MRNFLLTLLVFSLSFAAADALAMKKKKVKRDNVSLLNYEASVYRNGEEIRVSKNDIYFVKKKVVALFKNYTADTSEVWFKYDVEKHGETLEKRLNDLSASSFFKLDYKRNKEALFKRDGKFIPTEVLVEIHENPDDGFFGDVIAYNQFSQEIRAYQVDNKDLVSLYCFENIQPYLPEHYQALSEKYDRMDGGKSGVSCNLHMDQILREIAEKKKKKAEKWRKLRAKKHGLKLKENEDEE